MLLRELAVAFFGSELVYLVALAFLLAGTAVGALAGRALARHAALRLDRLFLAFALLLPAAIVFARGLRRLFAVAPGADLDFPRQLAATALLLVPFGALGGLLFQRAAAGRVAAGRTLAAAYGVESAGGLVGGLLGTLLIALALSNLVAGLAGAAIAAAAALLPGTAKRRPGVVATAALLATALTIALALSGPLDRALTGWNHPGLVTTRDTPYGRLAVTVTAGQVALFDNDALAWESQGTSAEELVHVAALESPSPRSVLVLGGALEGIVPELLAHRPERVEVVELDRARVEAVLPYLPAATRAALDASGVSLVFADPRRYLERTGVHDLLIVALPEPESGQANRFYTREFFAACARRLAPGGVLALRLRGAENLWTPALARRTASIERALAAVFPSVLVLPGSTHLVLASPAPLVRDPGLLAARLAGRGITTRLVTPAWLRWLFTNDRVEEIAGRLARTAAPENRDARPICYQYTLILWLARFFPVLGLLDLPEPGAGGLLATGALLALVALLGRRRERVRRTLLVAAAGFLGMVLEGALILAFQVRSGVLYQDLGLLLTLFMAGLAAGSLGVDRLLGGRASRRAGAAIVLAAAAVSGLTSALLYAGIWSGLAGSAFLLGAAGTAVGALFAYASLARVSDPGAVVAPLYAADLAGGSLGALAGSLLLLPVLGLPGTALLLAAMALGLLALV